MVRLYSSTKGINIKQLGQEQARFKLAGHSDGAVTSVEDLMFHMLRANGAEAPSLSVEMAVLREAEKKELSLSISDRGQPIEAWRWLRSSLELIRNGELDWDNKAQKVELDLAYKACKGHVIGRADTLFTTNGNTRADEMSTWGRAESLYGEKAARAFPPVGTITSLGIFVAEAARDSEINILNTLTTPGLPLEPSIVVLSGDSSQFSPVNTCNSKDFQTNPCMEEFDVSLFERLAGENFPQSRLLEQCEMAATLIVFPNRMFYGGQLASSSGAHRTLKDRVRYLLSKTIGSSISNVHQRNRYAKRATDAQARLHWLEMPDVEMDVKKSSKAIPLHTEIFMKKAFPGLQSLFGADMQREVLLLVAYGNALHLYEDELRKHQEQSKLSDAHYPRTMSIDAAQGQKATMVILDGSMQYADQLGFMADHRRSNVAMTRATDFFWAIGDSMK
ncbi:putative P-loop containing nucleoside triphosphate hydrolase, DNA2/NAM7 helicase-like protein [Septoria linicola]|nr:putative P-loop containing nucleoside triphosphate hydrolase, DNA2/NAM7 helicase-like protein [Septoria linicola]